MAQSNERNIINNLNKKIENLEFKINNLTDVITNLDLTNKTNDHLNSLVNKIKYLKKETSNKFNQIAKSSNNLNINNNFNQVNSDIENNIENDKDPFEDNEEINSNSINNNINKSDKIIINKRKKIIKRIEKNINYIYIKDENNTERNIFFNIKLI